MDLMSSLLRVAEAEEYITTFKAHGIEPFSLKLLDHEDLVGLGIKDEQKRNTILNKIALLQIPAESRKSTVIDKAYVKLMLYQMSNHLHKHLANLSSAVMREDIIITDLKLGPSVECLKQSITILEHKTRELRNRRIKGSNKFNVFVYSLFCGMLATSTFVFVKFVVK